MVAGGLLATAGWLVAVLLSAEVLVAELQAARPARHIPATAIARIFTRWTLSFGKRCSYWFASVRVKTFRIRSEQSPP